MDNNLHYVAGDFEGYYYTLQKNPLSISEKTPTGGLHNVHLYKGELKNAKSIEFYKPEEHLNRDSLFLHNVTNVQIHPGEGTPVSEKKIYDFDQIVLKNVEVVNSWELNDKTYGILKGQLLGKVKSLSSLKPPIDPTQKDPKIPPPPIGGDKKLTLPPPPIGGGDAGWRKFIPPVTPGNNNRGCLSWLWDLLKWIFIILLLFLLYKSCFKKNTDNSCCQEIESIRKQNDSLLLEIDSLENQIRMSDSMKRVIQEEDKIQDEINDISERIYFYGNSDEIRKYSKNSIQDLIGILKKYPKLNLEIQGHTNGTNPDYNGLDLRRAEKVKDLLIENGVDSDRLSTVGMGGAYPIVTEESRERDPWGNEYNANMRVEIKIRK